MRIFGGDVPPDILIAGDVFPRPPRFRRPCWQRDNKSNPQFRHSKQGRKYSIIPALAV